MYPTRHALLRDRRSWQAALTALVADDDGVLSLQPLPQPPTPVILPPPYEVEASGLATAPCLGLFVADTAHDRVIFRDDFCCYKAVVAPVVFDCAEGLGFAGPRGLAYGSHGFAVADGGHARILTYRVETLVLLRDLQGPFTDPRGVALDAQGRFYVLDHASKRIERLHADGMLDTAYGDALSAQLQLPAFLALGNENVLWVSDAGSDSVRRFADDGTAGPLLPVPETGWKPRALAVAGARAYIADAHSGAIFAFEGDVSLGRLPGYRGPVTALAIGDDGALYIKPGMDDQVIVACAAAGVAASGELLAGPLDAGEGSDWERAALDVFVPQGARAELSVFFSDTAAPAPAANEWMIAPATDVLLATLASSTAPGPGQRRFLWLRARLYAGPNGEGPSLKQVQAATADEDYRQWLPSVYAEQDADTVLMRLLALARIEIGGAETIIADLPRLTAPDFVPMAALPWLADWLSFEVPNDLPAQAQREVLARAHEYARKRGTVAGLLAFVHLHTGLRPRLVEWHALRRIWQLGNESALGFDTALPPASADGMSVPDPTILKNTDPAWGCQAPERIVVGHSIVGADRPLPRADLGSVLFDDHAHRITIMVPAGQADDADLRARLREVVEAEKPAHVGCEICFIEPEMRIGMAARIGLDAVIAGEGEPLRLSESNLGHDTRLGGTPPPTGTVGQHARIGRGLVLG
ncbi:MAG: phage tail protein [Lysobacter sp.]|nr:phage tail protein [Lysobacter sp.]